jgi:multiple antibiotic resistance protein
VLQFAKSVLLVISALFPIVDPIGGSPIFLSLTRQYDAATRRLLARRIAINSFLLLLGAFTVGSHVLSFFGLSLPVVQVGGGLVVMSTAWALLKKKDDNDRDALGRSIKSGDVLGESFYPLTLPLTVGPGSISIAITLGANEPRQLTPNVLAIVAAAVGSAVIAATIYIFYGFADRLASVVGQSGMNVILRLTSFLLLCIGVQILWNGASVLLRSLVPQ